MLKRPEEINVLIRQLMCVMCNGALFAASGEILPLCDYLLCTVATIMCLSTFFERDLGHHHHSLYNFQHQNSIHHSIIPGWLSP